MRKMAAFAAISGLLLVAACSSTPTDNAAGDDAAAGTEKCTVANVQTLSKQGTACEHADLKDADLSHADLFGADLNGAICDGSTIWPDGTWGHATCPTP